MSAEIVNLRRARKAKARAEKDRLAEENRRRHGLTRAERQGAAREAERSRADLDGKRLAPGELASDDGQPARPSADKPDSA